MRMHNFQDNTHFLHMIQTNYLELLGVCLLTFFLSSRQCRRMYLGNSQAVILIVSAKHPFLETCVNTSVRYSILEEWVAER